MREHDSQTGFCHPIVDLSANYKMMVVVASKLGVPNQFPGLILKCFFLATIISEFTATGFSYRIYISNSRKEFIKNNIH